MENNNKTPLTPEQEIAQLRAQLAQEQKEKQEALELNAEVQQKLDERDAAAKLGTTLPVVTVDGKKYVVKARQFQTLAGQIISASELAENKELCAELVDAGSGLLQEVA